MSEQLSRPPISGGMRPLGPPDTLGTQKFYRKLEVELSKRRKKQTHSLSALLAQLEDGKLDPQSPKGKVTSEKEVKDILNQFLTF